MPDSFVCEHRLGMKAFMDDLFVMSTSTQATQLLLDRSNQALTWAGMSFRAEKSRCIVIAGGVVRNVAPFTVSPSNSTGSQVIPSIHSQPVRFLGRNSFASLSDSENIKSFISVFKEGIHAIN